jgi:hypothetical protein
MHDPHQENHARAITKKLIKHQYKSLVKDFVEYFPQAIPKWRKYENTKVRKGEMQNF